MADAVQKVAAQALGRPVAGRALLVEKLLESLSGEAHPAVERTHLAEVRRRRQAVRSSEAKLLDGDQALRRARDALR